MSETAFLLACLSILLGVAAWAYRSEYLATLRDYNVVLREYQEANRLRREERAMLTNSERQAWGSYKRAFLISLDNDKARIAAEEHIKDLRSQIEELQARAEAQKREEADTEVYDETGDAEEDILPSGRRPTCEQHGDFQAERGPGEMVRDY